MIAAVDHSQKCAWGWGHTKQEAYDHAQAERAEKLPGVSWNQLDYCALKPGADLEHGGLAAYKHIDRPGSAEMPAQNDLFGVTA